MKVRVHGFQTDSKKSRVILNTLLLIPSEVIFEIGSFLEINDYYNFSLSCKTVCETLLTDMGYYSLFKQIMQCGVEEEGDKIPEFDNDYNYLQGCVEMMKRINKYRTSVSNPLQNFVQEIPEKKKMGKTSSCYERIRYFKFFMNKVCDGIREFEKRTKCEISFSFNFSLPMVDKKGIVESNDYHGTFLRNDELEKIISPSCEITKINEKIVPANFKTCTDIYDSCDLNETKYTYLRKKLLQEGLCVLQPYYIVKDNHIQKSKEVIINKRGLEAVKDQESDEIRGVKLNLESTILNGLLREENVVDLLARTPYINENLVENEKKYKKHTAACRKELHTPGRDLEEKRRSLPLKEKRDSLESNSSKKQSQIYSEILQKRNEVKKLKDKMLYNSLEKLIERTQKEAKRLENEIELTVERMEGSTSTNITKATRTFKTKLKNCKERIEYLKSELNGFRIWNDLRISQKVYLKRMEGSADEYIKENIDNREKEKLKVLKEEKNLPTVSTQRKSRRNVDNEEFVPDFNQDLPKLDDTLFEQNVYSENDNMPKRVTRNSLKAMEGDNDVKMEDSTSSTGNNFFLELGFVCKRSDDGHPIHKGGFSLKMTNENVGTISLAFVPNPPSPDVYEIVSLVVDKENQEVFEKLFAPMTLELNTLQGEVLSEKKFLEYSLLTQPLQRHDGKNQIDVLIEKKIIKLIDKSEIKEKGGVNVVFRPFFAYQADWKGLLACFKKLNGLWSPSRLSFNETRKTDQFSDEKMFKVSDIFNHAPDIYRNGFLRSSVNLTYLDAIPIRARLFDDSLHGNSRGKAGLLFSSVCSASLGGLRHKSKVLKILQKYGVIKDANISVTKKSSMSVGHKRVKVFEDNFENVMSEILGMYEKDYIKLKNQITVIENKQNKKYSHSREADLLKKDEKMKSLEYIIKLHKSTFPSFFKMFSILKSFKNVRKESCYLPHEPEFIEREFLSFEFVKDGIVPLLEKIRRGIKETVDVTEVASYYASHFCTDFIIYLVTWWSVSLDQRTNELFNMLINRALRQTSHFGGRESKGAKDIPICGSEGKTKLTRKIDTWVSVLANIYRKKSFERKTKYC